MDRRMFHKLAGMGAIAAFAGKSDFKAEAAAKQDQFALAPLDKSFQIPSRKVAWPSETYRRLLIDMHVPDWDELMAKFDPVELVARIAGAGFQSFEQDANSCAGLCLWRTKVGKMHHGMHGRDYFGEVMEQCRRHGLHRVAYYVVVFDDWAYENHPDWRTLPEDGYDSELFTRMGAVCINSPYREHTLACLRELVGNYDFEGIFLDETFWPTPCYCPHCTTRFWHEYGAELPRIVDWTDPKWRTFQRAREKWMLEFTETLTKEIKAVRPISVYQQFSTMFSPWQLGISLEQNAASDFCGGDFYGGPTQASLVCKAYLGLSKGRVFEIMTSRATPSLNDFETTKSVEQLLLETMVPTIHGGAYMLIDAIKPEGALNPNVYDYMLQINARHDAYEPYVGGELLADIAIYYDKSSMYDPEIKGIPAAAASPNIAASHSGPKNLGLPPTPSPQMKLPHLDAVIGAARILRGAHLSFGVVTNISLDQLSRYRAVIVPNVLEMTEEQASRFREFVRNGGILYASGPSSLSPPEAGEPRFFLEDVLGVRYLGRLGEITTYLSPIDPGITKAIWPQQNVTYPGSMVRAQALGTAKTLATVTLPFVPPNVGYTIGAHFAQLWNNPPASEPGHDPAIVVNSYGKGKTIWVSAAVESQGHITYEGALYSTPVYADLVTYLLSTVLTAPYKFELDTHPAVEMTLFHQPDKNRLMAALLNMQEQVPAIPVGATVRVTIPDGKRAKRIVQVPEKVEIPMESAGPYIQFKVPPFQIAFMALVEYE